MPEGMTRAELVERILFAVDGYRFGEWSLIDAGYRIQKLIVANPEAAVVHATPSHSRVMKRRSCE